MRELVSFIARALVTKPDAVSVSDEVDGHSRILKLRVAPEDRGRVIGKEGRTARAIRTLLAVAPASGGKKAKLDIVD